MKGEECCDNNQKYGEEEFQKMGERHKIELVDYYIDFCTNLIALEERYDNELYALDASSFNAGLRDELEAKIYITKKLNKIIVENLSSFLEKIEGE